MTDLDTQIQVVRVEEGAEYEYETVWFPELAGEEE